MQGRRSLKKGGGGDYGGGEGRGEGQATGPAGSLTNNKKQRKEE